MSSYPLSVLKKDRVTAGQEVPEPCSSFRLLRPRSTLQQPRSPHRLPLTSQVKPYSPRPFCSRHLPGPGCHPSHAQNLLRHLSVHTGLPCSELSSRKAETACSSVSSTLSLNFLSISDGAEPKADAQKCLLEWRK